MAHHRQSHTKLAEFDELERAFPREGQSDLLKQIGGNLERRDNDSALRISIMMNKTGLELDKSSMYKSEKFQGKDGKIYALDTKDMHDILKSELGPPRHMPNVEAAARRRGIIFFEGVPSIKDQTGHFDLWNGFTPAGDDHWTTAKNVWLWVCE